MWADIRILAEASWSLTREFRKLFFSLSLSLFLSSFPLIVVLGFCCCGRRCCGFDGQLGFWPCRLQWTYGCCRWCHWAMLLRSLSCTESQLFALVATNSASQRLDAACLRTDPSDSRAYPWNGNGWHSAVKHVFDVEHPLLQSVASALRSTSAPGRNAWSISNCLSWSSSFVTWPTAPDDTWHSMTSVCLRSCLQAVSAPGDASDWETPSTAEYVARSTLMAFHICWNVLTRRVPNPVAMAWSLALHMCWNVLTRRVRNPVIMAWSSVTDCAMLGKSSSTELGFATRTVTSRQQVSATRQGSGDGWFGHLLGVLTIWRSSWCISFLQHSWSLASVRLRWPSCSLSQPFFFNLFLQFASFVPDMLYSAATSNFHISSWAPADTRSQCGRLKIITAGLHQ